MTNMSVYISLEDDDISSIGKISVNIGTALALAPIAPTTSIVKRSTSRGLSSAKKIHSSGYNSFKRPLRNTAQFSNTSLDDLKIKILNQLSYLDAKTEQFFKNNNMPPIPPNNQYKMFFNQEDEPKMFSKVVKYVEEDEKWLKNLTDNVEARCTTNAGIAINFAFAFLEHLTKPDVLDVAVGITTNILKKKIAKGEIFSALEQFEFLDVTIIKKMESTLDDIITLFEKSSFKSAVLYILRKLVLLHVVPRFCTS